MAVEQPNDHGYIFDSESSSEMVRLIEQDRCMTRGMGGVLAEQPRPAIAALHDVLDIACGPGGWALDVAFEYPHIEVTGIDISRTMVDYAHARARSQSLANASFGVMNMTQPLEFPANRFDLVNARYIFSVLHSNQWEPFIAECTRILRPGGILRLTEIIDYFTTSPSFSRLNALLHQALHQLGHGFTPDGRSVGITMVLPRMFRHAGYQQIQHRAHTLELSYGTDAWADYSKSLNVLAPQSVQLFSRLNIISSEEAQTLPRMVIAEAQAIDFCAMQYYMTVWGLKP